MWDSKPDSEKKFEKIKEKLIKEQGYICCYCGSRIKEGGNTRIEHLLPKSKEEYKNLTFDYGNLLASCQGGTKYIIHKVEENETLESIAEKYGVSIHQLEEVYVDTPKEIIEKYAKYDYDLDNLQVGDRIIIIPQADKKQQHCDNRKGNEEIDITPLQKDCVSKFSFDEQGKIRISDEVKKTVKVLGLNDNTLLVKNRETIVEKYRKISRNILNKHKTKPNAKQLIEKDLTKLILHFNTPNSSSKELTPFCFVKISVLQGN